MTRNANTMNTLDPSYRTQLDQFIEHQYDKLTGYAIHLWPKTNYEDSSEILHDTIVRLYEGKTAIDFSKTPLTYFQYLMRDTISRQNQNRQTQFEKGRTVTKRKNKVEYQAIREGLEALDKASTEAFDIELLDGGKRRILYERIKQRHSPRRQWLLNHILDGASVEAIYPVYQEIFQSTMTIRTFKIEVTRLIRWMRDEIVVQFPDAS